MKNRKAMLLIITLIGILFATIYLNLNIFREKNAMQNSNAQLEKIIEKKNVNHTLDYNKIIEKFKSNDFIIKSFEKNKEEEMIFDIIYKGNSKNLRDTFENIRNSGYKYEIININMNLKENKGESFIKFKIHP
ncbi:hypothetical protein [Clostridium cochlearium]|uniref:Uncharacterized protein n=1 Tax=Clostridium cochlearium TaxID=1494 RepID=A0A1G9H5G8_CLOCO|nr:hypothetical protein [Clostridium cochlearium]MBE6065338.1 hypothetical protein [Clostridium cochlearium]MBU5269000.1 hypothetical protein [Clostridium cochlearium]MCR1970411.1 hypothetical protein [Clostridium cochlearium]MDU1443767.1 hypothetical protein [Clostridium cochlearium]NME94846.1 hypothetical protein [Clostridium cochlearium]